MKKKHLFGVVALFMYSTLLAQETVWINEFHYDNNGDDVGEFIEIAGVAGTDLSSYNLAVYDGSGSRNGMVDADVQLAGSIPDEGNGYGAIVFSSTSTPNLNSKYFEAGPDGYVLYNNISNEIIQFISYEGVVDANDGPAMGMMSIDVGVEENSSTPVGQSLQLTGTGTPIIDFSWVGPSMESPGMLNAEQVIVVAPVAPIPTLSEWGVFTYFLLLLNLGLIAFLNVAFKPALAGTGSTTFQLASFEVPFDKNTYFAVLRRTALWFPVVSLAIIFPIWGTVVMADIIGIVVVLPLVAYLTYLLRIFPKG